MYTLHFFKPIRRALYKKPKTGIEKNNDFTYTYKLLDGISYVKGAIKVLKDLNYPNEIINYFYN
jgi:DNA mismatch repair ATPase MutS